MLIYKLLILVIVQLLIIIKLQLGLMMDGLHYFKKLIRNQLIYFKHLY